MLAFWRGVPLVARQRLCSAAPSPGRRMSSLTEVEDDFEPVQLDRNPYAKSVPVCVLCKHKVQLDYKNSRLLQQFVSTFSGRVYEQHITGLCDKQYKALLATVALSRKAGYMPVFTKDPKYLRDPKLFDPMRPTRPHSFA